MKHYSYPQSRVVEKIEITNPNSIILGSNFKPSHLLSKDAFTKAITFFRENKVVPNVGARELRNRSKNFAVTALSLCKDTFANAPACLLTAKLQVTLCLIKYLESTYNSSKIINSFLRKPSFLSPKNSKTTPSSFRGSDVAKEFFNLHHDICCFLNTYGKVLAVDESSQKFIGEAAIIENYLSLFRSIKDDYIKNNYMIDDIDIIIFTLANSLDDYFGFINKVQLPRTAVSNRELIEIKEFLTPDSWDRILDLIKQNKSLEILLNIQNKGVTYKDVYKINKNGILEFSPSFFKSFIDMYYEHTYSSIIKSNFLAIKIKNEKDNIEDYIKKVIAYGIAKNVAVDKKYFVLLQLFIDDVDVTDEGKLAFSLDFNNIDLLSDEVTRLKEVYESIVDLIYETINMLYSDMDDQYASNFSVYRYIKAGQDLIYRLEFNKARLVEPVFHMVSGFVNTNAKNATGSGVGINEYEHSIIQPNVFSFKTDFVKNIYPHNMNDGAPNAVTSSYGACVTNLSKSDVYKHKKRLGRYYESEINTVSNNIRLTCFSSLYTIKPPKDGYDHISFGLTSRRCTNSSKFEIEVVNQNSDIIDLILSVPARLIEHLQDDADRKTFYMGLIENLAKTTRTISKTKFVGPSLIEKNVGIASSILNAMTEDKLPLRKISNNQLPTAANTRSMLNSRSLPEIVVSEKILETRYYIPIGWLEPSIKLLLMRDGYVHQGKDRRGNDKITLLRLDSSKLKDIPTCYHSVVTEAINTKPSDEVCLCVIKSDKRDISSADLFSNDGKLNLRLTYTNAQITASSKRHNLLLKDQEIVNFSSIFRHPFTFDSNFDKWHNLIDYMGSLISMYFFYQHSSVYTNKDQADKKKKVLLSELVDCQNILVNNFPITTDLFQLNNNARGTLIEICSLIDAIVNNNRKDDIVLLMKNFNHYITTEMITMKFINFLNVDDRLLGLGREIADGVVYSLSCQTLSDFKLMIPTGWLTEDARDFVINMIQRDLIDTFTIEDTKEIMFTNKVLWLAVEKVEGGYVSNAKVLESVGAVILSQGKISDDTNSKLYYYIIQTDEKANLVSDNKIAYAKNGTLFDKDKDYYLAKDVSDDKVIQKIGMYYLCMK